MIGVTAQVTINDELTDADRRVLTEFGKNAAVSIDIGTFVGGSAEAILLGGGIVYTIDNYAGLYNQTARACPPELLKHLAADRLDQYGERVVLLIGDSLSFARLFPEASIDFVFVDGGHDFTNAKSDIEAWLPALKPNGIMAGHDLDRSLLKGTLPPKINDMLADMDRGPDNRHYGVFKALVETFTQFETAKDIESSIWWVKPEWKK